MVATAKSSTNTSLFPEDLVLGPPATAFASSARSKGRISDVHEKNVDRQNSATFGDDLPTNDRSGNLRDRVFGGRDSERTLRDRNDRNDRNNPLGRRNTREGDGEGWTPVARPRRGSQADEGDRWQRLGDRKDKEGEAADDQNRRNGVGRGRFERSNWQRDNDQAIENDTPKTGARNWRERERERERGERGDREWTRGNRMPDRVDENPEWMDSPAPKEGKKQAHTQEDFERWKETMKASNRASEEPEQAPAPAPAKENVKSTAIKLELADSLFNTWGTGLKPEPKKQLEEPLPGIGATQISASAKQAKAAKASRFVGLFQKEETPPVEVEPPQVTPPAAQPLNGSAKKTEDEEGFARILQMLGGTKIGGAPQQPSMAQNRQMINDLDFERKQDRTPVSSRPESAQLIEDLMSRVRGNKSRGPQTAPAESETAQQYFPSPGADYGRGQHVRNDNVTPRTNGMFSPPLQQHMNNMEPRHLPDGNSRDILLSMIQQGRQQQEPEQFNFSGQRKQQANMQHEGMQRPAPSAPPGLLDGPFPRRDQESDMQSLRKATSRPQQQPPPGFFDGFPDDPAIMGGNHPGLTRRNTTEQQHTGRLPPMSNMGIPSQQAPTDPFRGMNMPPLNNGPERNMGPPPGFGNLGGIRPPPGFQGPPPQQMPPHGVGHPGLRDPRGAPMFGPPGMQQVGLPPPGYQTFNGPPPPQQGMPNGPPPGFGVPRDHQAFMMMQQPQFQGPGRMPDELMGRGGRGGMPPGYM